MYLRTTVHQDFENFSTSVSLVCLSVMLAGLECFLIRKYLIFFGLYHRLNWEVHELKNCTKIQNKSNISNKMLDKICEKYCKMIII